MKKILLGMLLGTVGYTIIDSLCSLVEQAFGYIISRIGAATVPYAKIVQELNEDDTNQYSTQAIGFEIPQTEIWEDDTDD